jgi:hypothetical protein
MGFPIGEHEPEPEGGRPKLDAAPSVVVAVEQKPSLKAKPGLGMIARLHKPGAETEDPKGKTHPAFHKTAGSADGFTGLPE